MFLKKDGLLYLEVPFLYEEHGVPEDYQRWTLSGLEHLLNRFTIIDQGVNEGPSSVWNRFTRLYLASFFRNRYLYHAVKVVYTWLFFWIKYLDILIPEKNFKHMAMGYYIIAKK